MFSNWALSVRWVYVASIQFTAPLRSIRIIHSAKEMSEVSIRPNRNQMVCIEHYLRTDNESVGSMSDVSCGVRNAYCWCDFLVASCISSFVMYIRLTWSWNDKNDEQLVYIYISHTPSYSKHIVFIQKIEGVIDARPQRYQEGDRRIWSLSARQRIGLRFGIFHSFVAWHHLNVQRAFIKVNDEFAFEATQCRDALEWLSRESDELGQKHWIKRTMVQTYLELIGHSADHVMHQFPGARESHFGRWTQLKSLRNE